MFNITAQYRTGVQPQSPMRQRQELKRQMECIICKSPLGPHANKYCSLAHYWEFKRRNPPAKTDPIAAEIVLAYQNEPIGMTLIAKRYKVSIGKVRDILRCNGVVINESFKRDAENNRRRDTGFLGKPPKGHQAMGPKWNDAKAFDGCNHWYRHPIAYQWRYCISARRNYTKFKHDPAKRIKRIVRTRIAKMLHLRGHIKDNRTVEYVGCSMPHLVQHIESQFTKGMAWHNHGREWELDHIKPCAAFDLSDTKQVNECFNWKNLQPLGKRENRIKSSWFKGKYHSQKNFR